MEELPLCVLPPPLHGPPMTNRQGVSSRSSNVARAAGLVAVRVGTQDFLGDLSVRIPIESPRSDAGQVTDQFEDVRPMALSKPRSSPSQ